MTRITLDAILREKLPDLSQPLELCDEQGKLVARLYPVVDSSAWIPWEPEITKEELDQRMQTAEWLTSEQAMAYLEKLGCFR